VQIPIAVNIARRDGLAVAQARLRRPDLAGSGGKLAVRGSLVEKKPVELRANEIQIAVPRELSEGAGEDQTRIVSAKRQATPAPTLALAQDAILCGKDDLGLPVVI